MQCPRCGGPTLYQHGVRQGTLVDVCSECHGLWLDCGEVLEFSSEPEELESELAGGLVDRKASDRKCPRCQVTMEQGLLPGRDSRVDACNNCGGYWFDSEAVKRIGQSSRLALEVPEEPVAESDPQIRAAAEERSRQLAAGALALPNLLLRSTLTLAFLYGLLAIALISAVEFTRLTAPLAVAIGVGFAVLQFTLGPWIMDLCLRWLYNSRWLRPEEMPEHLRDFVARVCTDHRMKFPSVAMIDDGAPVAFTYGHHPSNARVVISRGILELLNPPEVEAVVAHELGHARNWDMALMTIANLVPLLLYYVYRFAADRGGKKQQYSTVVSAGAYVLYIVSQYIVLWFSRTREYFADRFAGRVTNNPAALASALVKIAYGLAAQPGRPAPSEGAESDERKEQEKEYKARAGRIAALGALNIFDSKAAIGLAAAAGGTGEPGQLDVERVKSAMQWDLWNPWAMYYEIHSTHPLVAKRLQLLGDQAAEQGQKPLVMFDRRRPESYWDDFLVDLFMMVLPTLCFLIGAAACAGSIFLTIKRGPFNPIHLAWLTAGIALAGLASLIKTRFVYRRDFFARLSVAALLHKVKVSAVRPIPVTLRGSIIGKGVPGLIWSEDFVLRDRTGIILMDYRQPLAIWNWLFGMFRAGAYQGKEVQVTGWFRRAPVPYLEVNRVDVLDGSLPSRRCYSYHARIIVGVFLAIFGTALTAIVFLR